MKFLLVLLFELCFINSFGQSKNPDINQLRKVLDLTMKQKPNEKNNNTCENGLCGEWWANNKNDFFYKNDTVKIYNSSNFAPLDSGYCKFKIWEFDKKINFHKEVQKIVLNHH